MKILIEDQKHVLIYIENPLKQIFIRIKFKVIYKLKNYKQLLLSIYNLIS